MHLLTSLLILIVLARLLGHLFKKFDQPSVVGEMLAGLILGPTVLGLVQANEAISSVSELAVFLVILSAGLEMSFDDVVGAMRGRGLVIAISGFLLPFAMGVGVGIVFELDTMRTIFLGLCVSITALPVAVKLLESFNLLQTDIARYSVATAVLNDVAALLILGVILNLPEEKSFANIGLAVAEASLKLLLLTLIILAIYRLIKEAQIRGFDLKSLPERLVSFFGAEALFGGVILFVLLFGSISEGLGFHFVIGAFFGALLIDRKFFFPNRYSELERTLGSVSNGFLAPVFFAYIGLELSVDELRSLDFLLAVIIVSIASKILAGWLGGIMVGLGHRPALSIGIMLNARGVMELVIASIAFKKGFIGPGMFSALVIMGVVTTVITPILYKRFGVLKT